MVPRSRFGWLEASLMHLRLDAARECVIRKNFSEFFENF